MRDRDEGGVSSAAIKIGEVLRHPLASGASQLAVARYVAAGIGLLTMIIATRFLGPTKYGVAALVLSYPTLLWSFASFKPVSVITRYLAGFRASGRRQELLSLCKVGYGLEFLTAAAVVVLVAASGWWVADHVYRLPDVAWLMVGYAMSFPFCALIGTSWAILSSWQQFRWLAAFQIFERGIVLVLVLLFLQAGWGVAGMVLGMAIGQAVAGLAIAVVAYYTLAGDGLGAWWKASLGHVRSLRSELTAFFGWNYLGVTFTGLLAQVPLMLLGRLRGPEEAGFYRVATTLMTAGAYFETSLGAVSYPLLSARWSGGQGKGINQMLKRWTLREGLLAGGLVLLAIPLLPIVVPWVFGAAYRPIVFGVQLMMVGAAISAIFFWLNSYYYTVGKFGLWTKVHGIHMALTILLGWWAIQRWGFIGMAIVVAVGKVVLVLSLLGFLKNSPGQNQ